MSTSPLMTSSEVIAYLRLDQTSKCPEKLLYRLRAAGRLAGVRLGQHVMYRRADVERFVNEQCEAVPV